MNLNSKYPNVLAFDPYGLSVLVFCILIFHFANHAMVIIRYIKDIAKLRGSEDLWEVAKLHDRESSFPVVFIIHNCDLLK